MAKRPLGKIGGAKTSGRFVQFAIVGFGVFLLLILLNGIVQVRLVTGEQEKLLPNYLELVGRTVAGYDGYKDYYFFLEYLTNAETGDPEESSIDDYYGTTFWERVTADLAAAEAAEFVKSAEILGISGVRIMNAEGEVFDATVRNVYRTSEQTAIEQAVGGQISTPQIARNDLRRSTYIPIRSADNRVIALLRLEASAEKFVGLEVLRNRLFFIFCISGAVLTFLYLMTVRLMRRSIEAEKAMARADRLRALGSMTAGIAHEIRNPLGILTLQVEEMEAELGTMPPGKSRTNLERLTHDLKDELLRVRKLTENFLSFSGASDSNSFFPQQIDVGQIAGDVVRIWSKGLDPKLRKVEFRIDAIGDSGAIGLFSEDRLKQILLNLLRNADEAMGRETGMITITVASSGRELTIAVADTGPGVDALTQGQIFDPFYTTRADGTGLGLSVSRALAESAGGSLTIESAKGKGAVFTLSMRAARKEREAT